MEPRCIGTASHDKLEGCGTCKTWGECGVLFKENTEGARKMENVMVSVQRSHSICMAHRLQNHPGKCRSLHGHNYTITYHLSGRFNHDTGMIVDFSEIKRALCQTTEEQLDHKTLLQKDDPLIPVLTAELGDNAVVTVDAVPTAENMAMMILISLQSTVPKGAKLYRVDVEETAGCKATAEAINKGD